MTSATNLNRAPERDLNAGLLTVADIAVLIQVHKRTVLDLIAAGDLRAINIGGTRAHGARWRVSQHDLTRFLESRASRAI